MRLVFAMIGAFFEWLFQLKRKKRKNYKEVLWGHKHDVHWADYRTESIYWGMVVCVAIIFLLSLFC